MFLLARDFHLLEETAGSWTKRLRETPNPICTYALEV
jgi:hypothetical protein